MAEQKQMQEAYSKASSEDKRTCKFFKDLPLENMIDHEAIAYARQAGLTDPVFKTGRMSNALVQKMNYMKSKHRSNMLLRKWSSDGYWCRQNEVLKVNDPSFTDTIERISINDLTVEQFIERYEKGNRPVIITGVTDTWPGATEWQLKVSKFCLSMRREFSCVGTACRRDSSLEHLVVFGRRNPSALLSLR